MARYIGIRHRVKWTAEGEARPTMVAIREEERVKTYVLENDTAELDFVLGRFQKRKDNEPEGLKPGDVVAMILGGSGDRLAFALSKRGEEIGAKVLRLPPFTLKERRDASPKDEDHLLLSHLVEANPELFQPVGVRDRELIRLREAYRARRDAMKDRIACEQRLYQQFIGRIFLNEDGGYPEGLIEDVYDREKASDKILNALLEEEAARESELKRVVRCLDVWKNIFAEIEGVGEVIAAGIIAAIGDIRRFETPAKLKAYLGVHVFPDGSFPRKRSGAVANWSPEGRQALFLLGDQFNYRPDSEWGKRLREFKKAYRGRHPEVVMENGKKRYTDAHIHKLGRWRTLTRFTERLWKDWTRLEQAA